MIHVYGVFASHVDRVGTVEVLFPTERHAREHAQQRSTESGILATSVIRYTMCEPGTRTAVCRYRDGRESDRR